MAAAGSEAGGAGAPADVDAPAILWDVDFLPASYSATVGRQPTAACRPPAASPPLPHGAQRRLPLLLGVL